MSDQHWTPCQGVVAYDDDDGSSGEGGRGWMLFAFLGLLVLLSLLLFWGTTAPPFAYTYEHTHRRYADEEEEDDDDDAEDDETEYYTGKKPKKKERYVTTEGLDDAVQTLTKKAAPAVSGQLKTGGALSNDSKNVFDKFLAKRPKPVAVTPQAAAAAAATPPKKKVSLPVSRYTEPVKKVVAKKPAKVGDVQAVNLKFV